MECREHPLEHVVSGQPLDVRADVQRGDLDTVPASERNRDRAEARLDLVGNVAVALRTDLRLIGFDLAQGVFVLGDVAEQVRTPPLVVESTDAALAA
jgi:hypothetical protein